MSASEIVYLFHWVIYILSFVAFVLLFTRYYRLGAIWIGVLFLVQTIFHGCPVVMLQNYFRVKEGLPPIIDGMLTDRFSSLIGVQVFIAGVISLIGFSLLLL